MTDNIENIFEFEFPSSRLTCYFDADWKKIIEKLSDRKLIFVTDENLFRLYDQYFEGKRVIVTGAGEEHKTQLSIDHIIHHLMQFEADKESLLIGFGGGVITDIVGYAASIYKRGIPFGFVPTTIMAMADAAIGGKNGINYGAVKNVIGTICQPEIIIYDFEVLKTLPPEEWINGIAEVIKYGCIADAILFEMLEKFDLHQIQTDISLVAMLIERCLKIKMTFVTKDVNDKGERKKLNFGHTLGHAIERLHELPHGHAISIGMVAACALSEKFTGLHFSDAVRVVQLLSKYHLPVDVETEHSKVFEILRQDKKRKGEEMDVILLRKIGVAEIYPLSLDYLQSHLKEII